MPKVFTVVADVHKPIGNGYRVKVSVTDIGLYINGMVIYPPNDEHNDWSVNTPSRPAGRGKYARIVEFNMKLPLWQEIHEACIETVKGYISDGLVSHVQDVVVMDIPDGPLNLDDVPF